MMVNDRINSKEKVAELLFNLHAYAKAQNLSIKELSAKLNIPYDTLCKWPFFTQRKDKQNPSKPYINRIKEFLEGAYKPEVPNQIEEAKRRAAKIKYLLLLLEDELGWFRDNNPNARDAFRKELDASDIGYISSLLTMMTQEDKFRRWLALTTIQFQSFKRR